MPEDMCARIPLLQRLVGNCIGLTWANLKRLIKTTYVQQTVQNKGWGGGDVKCSQFKFIDVQSQEFARLFLVQPTFRRQFV